MSRVPTSHKLRLVMVGLIGGIVLAIPFGAFASDDSAGADVAELERRIADLEQTLAGIERLGDTVVFEGVNLQLVNGEGATSTANGLGNLIVGYNEDIGESADRSGSHYIVVGDDNEWSSHVGIAVGRFNSVVAPYGSVTGGSHNTVSGKHGTIAGGYLNEASGNYAAVSGGTYNHASGAGSSVSGGHRGAAEQYVSSVHGGIRNTAGAVGASVAGGVSNSANGYLSSILGGDRVTITDRFAHWPE